MIQKTATGNSIPSKTFNLRSGIPGDVFLNRFNDMLSTGNFPDDMKLADPLKKKIIDLNVFYLLFQKFLKNSFKSQSLVTWKVFSPNTYVAIVKAFSIHRKHC